MTCMFIGSRAAVGSIPGPSFGDCLQELLFKYTHLAEHFIFQNENKRLALHQIIGTAPEQHISHIQTKKTLNIEIGTTMISITC